MDTDKGGERPRKAAFAAIALFLCIAFAAVCYFKYVHNAVWSGESAPAGEPLP